MNVLITGTTSGIGRALAERMIAAEHGVWGVARRRSELASLQGRLGPAFRYSAADVARTEDVARVLSELDAAEVLPDAVVLNAGIYPHDCEETFDYAVARDVLATNVDGALAFVDPLLKRFLERGSGQFLAVSSVFAVRPDPLGVGYAASKAALTMAFRSLATRFRRTPIRFKSVLLGPIATDGYAGGEHEQPAMSLHLRSADQAAAAIQRALAGGRSLTYYPWLVGAAFRATGWLPDAAFNALTEPFRR